MKLTDEQLRRLLHFNIWRVAHSGDCESGMDLDRLELVELTVSRGNSNYVWQLTDLGREVLKKDLVRALHMVPYVHTEHAVRVVREHFSTLTIEELTSLLVHRIRRIRTMARARMKKLVNETN